MKDVHSRLTEITDELLGYASTMPTEQLLERLEKALPRLKKGLELVEAQGTYRPLVQAAIEAHEAWLEAETPDARRLQAAMKKLLTVLEKYLAE